MISKTDETFIRRCFQLALQGSGKVKSNPNVGAVLVYNERITGEGFHEEFGGPHAEVNALRSVSLSDQKYIKDSCLYISLEPCNHIGKTGACTQLILDHGIKRVKISCLDPNPQMNGKSIRFLKNHQVDVEHGILEKEGKSIIRPFETYLEHNRPYVILKFAQSQDAFIGKKGKQIWLSNARTQILNHKWRTEIDALLIGVNTLINDNPSLTTRFYPGPSPLRILIDPAGRSPGNAKLFRDKGTTWVFTRQPYSFQVSDSTKIFLVDPAREILGQIMESCIEYHIFRLLVEGGTATLEQFMKHKIWDEARIIRTPHFLDEGIKAPQVSGFLEKRFVLDEDEIIFVANTSP